jgi:hypothetical protein
MNYQPLSLTQYIETLEDKFKLFKESFPQSFLAAETLNNLFWQVYNEEIIPKSEIHWQNIVHKMLFGSMSSWSHAFLMTATGLNEHGSTSMRRSIEFACYIAKIRESNKKAEIWVARRKNIECAKRFSNEFAIPKAYLKNKYVHLKQLLVIHDHASEFAVHGNLDMLAQKLLERGSSITLTVFDDSKNVPLASAAMVTIGYLILQAITSDLRGLISNYTRVEEQFITLRDLLLRARDETYKFEFEAGIKREVLDTIKASPSLLEKKFEELKRRGTP